MQLIGFDGISSTLQVTALGSGAYLVAFLVVRAARVRGFGTSRAARPHVGWTARWLGSVGVALAIVSPAAGAVGGGGGGRRGPSSRQTVTPPWETGTIGPDAGRPAGEPWGSGRPLQATKQAGTHPSAESSAPPWSGNGSSPPRPLRRTGAVADVRSVRRAETHRSEADAHRADAPSSGEAQGAEWVVRPGDTLWDIAGQVLGTADQRRIARYWPSIHRANREVIGANPSLIFPGQFLRLPAEEPSK